MASVGRSSSTAVGGIRIQLRALYSARLRELCETGHNRVYSRVQAPDQKFARPHVAVLYQALEPPVIGGVRKPKKPGGYQDSGADIAYNLSICGDIEVITPSPDPDPANDVGWCFPDTEDGIMQALENGATHLWANTVLFTAHPLQASKAIEKYESLVQVVGQGPLVVDKYDDKRYVNDMLRRLGGLTMPKAWCIQESQDVAKLDGASYPVVAKPVRGRGSQGVKVCYDTNELAAHVKTLLISSLSIILEEFLEGEEVTITVMPPTPPQTKYWSLPIVTRFNHQEGISPYNGVVAVTANSRAISEPELDQFYALVAEECEKAAQALRVAALIRIDARRFKDSKDSQFALFDVNMKPNMTGPGRPGRDDQASLTLMAASALGWDYRRLLKKMLNTSHSLKELKALRPS
ncbi:glutathione synthetase ATP-binding domain-like protein [Hypoxylon sp. NC1633]|nr:glutathione synthetase ATP-binding domain-like protein [Hypoxylon sp. NC1633]